MNLIKGVRINQFNKSTEHNMTVHTHKSNMRVYACVQTRYMYMQTHTKDYLGSRALWR